MSAELKSSPSPSLSPSPSSSMPPLAQPSKQPNDDDDDDDYDYDDNDEDVPAAVASGDSDILDHVYNCLGESRSVNDLIKKISKIKSPSLSMGLVPKHQHFQLINCGAYFAKRAREIRRRMTYAELCRMLVYCQEAAERGYLRCRYGPFPDLPVGRSGADPRIDYDVVDSGLKNYGITPRYDYNAQYLYLSWTSDGDSEADDGQTNDTSCPIFKYVKPPSVDNNCSLVQE